MSSTIQKKSFWLSLASAAVVPLWLASVAFGDTTGSYRPECRHQTSLFDPQRSRLSQFLDNQPTVIRARVPFGIVAVPPAMLSVVPVNLDEQPTIIGVGNDAAKGPIPSGFDAWMRTHGYTEPLLIGHGGEGVVVQAKRGGEKRVALKYTDPRSAHGASSAASIGSARLRLRSEASLIGRMNVAEKDQKQKYFLEAKLSEDGLVMEMEFFPKNPDPKNPGFALKAPTLRDRIDKGDLSASMKRKIRRQLLEAVARMHAIGIIHRDLKPANILVDDNGKIKIIDLGLGSDDGQHPPGVDPENLSGTFDFMGPDQFAGRPASGKNDVDGLRKTLMAMILGNDTPYAFERAIGPYRAKDYRYAPEAELGGPLALAIWNSYPPTITEYIEGIEKAETLSPSAFYLWYGTKLTKLTGQEAAVQLLQSKEAIRNFPNGLGLSSDDVARIAAAFDKLEKETQFYRSDPTRRPGVLDETPYAYYAEFRARLTEIEKPK